MVIDIDAGSADGLHRWRRRILDTVVLHRVVKVLQRAYCIGAGQQHRAAGPASVGIERTQVCRTSGPCFGSWRCQQRGPLHEKCRKQPVREKKQPELRREERVLMVICPTCSAMARPERPILRMVLPLRYVGAPLNLRWLSDHARFLFCRTIEAAFALLWWWGEVQKTGPRTHWSARRLCNFSVLRMADFSRKTV